VASAKLGNRTLEAMGTFKADTLNVALLGKNQPLAQKIFDRAGFR
jgi:iron(III) transport system substrate-binding protein